MIYLFIKITLKYGKKIKIFVNESYFFKGFSIINIFYDGTGAILHFTLYVKALYKCEIIRKVYYNPLFLMF